MNNSAGQHRPRFVGHVAGTLVMCLLSLTGLVLMFIGAAGLQAEAWVWAFALAIWSAVPALLLSAAAMGLTHALTATMLPGTRQILVAAACGAVAGFAAHQAFPIVSPYASSLIGALAAAGGRAVAGLFVGPRPVRSYDRRPWQDRTYDH